MTPKEHKRILKTLEQRAVKLRHESRSNQLTLEQKLALLKKHKEAEEEVRQHKLNYFELTEKP